MTGEILIDPVQGTVHHSNVERFLGTEISYMSNSNPIKEKATEWWQLISKKETADSFKDFFSLTWNILKETALLVWLLLCSVLVAIGWVWDNSSKVSESVSDLQSKAKQPDGNMAAEAATKLWTASQTSAANALATARKQLNLPEKPAKAPKAKPAATKTDAQYAQEQAAKDAAAAAAAKAKAAAEAAKAQNQAATATAEEASEPATEA